MNSMKNLCFLSAFFILHPSSFILAQDWPQYQCNPQRTGYTPEEIVQPYFPAWGVCFLPEQVMPLVQPIIYQDKVFIGTKSGNLYAFAVETGDTAWKFASPWPIIHTAAAEDGRVFFAGADGTVYALDAATGALVWKHKTSGAITATPLLAENKLFIGTRNGIMHALDQKNGNAVWTLDMDAPIYNSAAYDNGRIYFGCEDMRLYCLDAADGTIAWKTDQLKYVQSFKGYCPVIHKGRVIVRPMQGMHPRNLSNWLGWVPQPFQWPPPAGYFEEHLEELQFGKLPAGMLDVQPEIITKLDEEPEAIEFFVFDAATGAPGPTAPVYRAFAMAGPVPPPAVDRDGMLILGVLFDGARFGRYDIERNRIVDLLIPNDTPAVALGATGNVDESYASSCAGSEVWIMHASHGNHGSGVYDLDTRFFHSLAMSSSGHSGVPWVGGKGWPDGAQYKMTNPESEAQSSDSIGAGMAMNDPSPASIAGGMFFHVSQGRLVAYRGGKPGSGFFASGEIRDWYALAETLRTSKSPAFDRIRGLLSQSTRDPLMHPQGTPKEGPRAGVKYGLLKDLNEALKRRDFYDAAAFAEVKFRDETRAGIGKGFDGLDEAGVVKLNRAILEDALGGNLFRAR